MRIAIVGAGPAGLYLAILLKRDDPGHQVTVFERNRVEDSFGFGVVFSDETLENVGEADPETNAAMAAEAARWEDIEIHYRGNVIRSTGHRFSGLEQVTRYGKRVGEADRLELSCRIGEADERKLVAGFRTPLLAMRDGAGKLGRGSSLGQSLVME